MQPSFSPQSLQDGIPASCIEPCATGVSGKREPSPGVSDGLHDRGAEDRLDRLIADLGHKAVHARAAGDKAKARELVDRMYAAIQSRSPEHVDRLHQDVDRRIAEQVDYFGYRGQLARELLAKRATEDPLA